MDEVEAKPDDKVVLDKKMEFCKMMLGIGAGWLAKEIVESGFTRFVKWRQSNADMNAE